MYTDIQPLVPHSPHLFSLSLSSHSSQKENKKRLLIFDTYEILMSTPAPDINIVSKTEMFKLYKPELTNDRSKYAAATGRRIVPDGNV
jgi:hypothetical protein